MINHIKTTLKLILIKLALVTLTPQIEAQLAFTLSSTTEIDNTPYFVIAADVNGDKQPDLICANAGTVIYPTNIICIFTNDGSGIFSSNGTYTVGSAPHSIATADINEDGYIDLISANFYSNSLSVLTNDGNGRFTSSGTYAVGKFPSSVVAADVNGDGHVDLIDANDGGRLAGASTLSVLTNSGNGDFGSNATYVVDSEPVCIVAKDVNGDGWVDLVSANLRGGSLSILMNNGSGRFSTSTSISTTQPNSVDAADINGDGSMDLICANNGYGTLSIYTNNGSGGFQSAGTIQVGSDPQSVKAVEVNNDGHIDLVNANMGLSELPENILAVPNSLSVSTNDGLGNFAVANTLILNGGPVSIVGADVNGDGKADLISAGNDKQLSVLMNIPILNFNFSTNTMTFFWPSAWTNWTLLQNTNLNTTNWTSFNGNIDDDGATKTATHSPLTGNRFFRLSHP